VYRQQHIFPPGAAELFQSSAAFSKNISELAVNPAMQSI
jgi:hypothetical protein